VGYDYNNLNSFCDKVFMKLYHKIARISGGSLHNLFEQLCVTALSPKNCWITASHPARVAVACVNYVLLLICICTGWPIEGSARNSMR
jgi:hypothetical protein